MGSLPDIREPRNKPQQAAQQAAPQPLLSASGDSKGLSKQDAAGEFGQHLTANLVAMPTPLVLDPQKGPLQASPPVACVTTAAVVDAVPLPSASLASRPSCSEPFKSAEAEDTPSAPPTVIAADLQHGVAAVVKEHPASGSAAGVNPSPVLSRDDAASQHSSPQPLSSSPDPVQTAPANLSDDATGGQVEAGQASITAANGSGSTDSGNATAVGRPGWDNSTTVPKASISNSRVAGPRMPTASASTIKQSSSPPLASKDRSTELSASGVPSAAGLADTCHITRCAVADANQGSGTAAAVQGAATPFLGAGAMHAGIAGTANRSPPVPHSRTAGSAAGADVYAVSDALLLDKLSGACSSSAGMQSATHTLRAQAASSSRSAEAPPVTSQVNYAHACC